ncbi:hypothetical protein [Anabaena sp. UHCC 0451]|uniref:hypothetical protein n=1 Tax=Anabaena sp. UHCC 0451 TaxID=2055235 RepID=UPI002B21BC7A|nr:hypothetical protein [Anabaena sp. UHCC 0451]MEA5576919.1 hypothetical protein [Anabaena sp. UHCC 0451]
MNNGKIVSSPEQVIEDLYQEVFYTIYKQIKGDRKGVLSRVIHLLAPDKAKEICQRFQIQNYGSLSDDLSISSSISSGVIKILTKHLKDKKKYEDILNNLLKVFKELLSLPKNEEIEKMELYQIVAIGILIVGVPSCVIYLQNQKEEQKEKQNHQSLPLPPQKVYARIALRLIVPASVVRNIKRNGKRNIRKDDPIDVSQIETLIENASYFLCTSAENETITDSIDQSLSTTNEDITNVSEEREVYVRINIHVDDAEKMIGNKVRYTLKTNLPTDGRQGTVRQLACLKYLSVSGLEKFNRI